MPVSTDTYLPEVFSAILFEKMKRIHSGVQDMELYEFRYALHNLYPQVGGWASVKLESMAEIEERVSNIEFFKSIEIKPRQDDRIVLDKSILHLSRMLLVGLVDGAYPVDWINKLFSFDLRGFYFLVRTVYFTETVKAHFGGKPFCTFEPRQANFERKQDVGYKEFKEANDDVDSSFIEAVKTIILRKGTPIVIAIAGPTAAGKTEIVERLRERVELDGKKVTSIELDNFLTDRDEREAKGIFTQGKQALHFDLFTQALHDICAGKKISIPRYDFVLATSSHDLGGSLKPGGVPLEIEPADIIFIEGNFPFLIGEVVHLIGVKVVYLTDDSVRLKRKWKRDIDYRKKYEPTYFRNRYFKDQFIMAEIAYRPQLEVCDICVDTTSAALWVTPEIAKLLG